MAHAKPKRAAADAQLSGSESDGAVVVRFNRDRQPRQRRRIDSSPGTTNERTLSPETRIGTSELPSSQDSPDPIEIAAALSSEADGLATQTSGANTTSPSHSVMQEPSVHIENRAGAILKRSLEKAEDVWAFFESRKDRQKEGFSTLRCKVCL
jgi:hypothetical protein